jgi:hypothetical protein
MLFDALGALLVAAGDLMTMGGLWLCWDVYKTQQYEGGDANTPFPLPFFKLYLRRDAAHDFGVALAVAGYLLGVSGGYLIAL